MEYRSADFNGTVPVPSTVMIYRHNGTSWIDVGQTSNSTSGVDTTIVKNAVNLSGNNPLVLGVAGGSDLPARPPIPGPEQQARPGH